jgi:hypothetical protein
MARGRSERSSAEDPAAWGAWPSVGWSGPPKQCGLPVPKDARRSPPLPEAVSPRAGPPTGLRGPSWGQARALSCGMPQRPRGRPRGASREAQEQASHPEQGNAHPEGTARGRPRRPGEKPVVKDAPAVAPWGRWPYPDRARHPPTVGEYRGGAHAAPAGPCLPARWVGRSPATRPRTVTPGDPPDDAPARGDQPPARMGVRQGLQMQLLAEAGRRPSVYPADLRLALSGVPHPRPAVLQPRRPAVSGARHRPAGGGAGPAVASQRSGQAPHRASRSGP